MTVFIKKVVYPDTSQALAAGSLCIQTLKQNTPASITLQRSPHTRRWVSASLWVDWEETENLFCPWMYLQQLGMRQTPSWIVHMSTESGKILTHCFSQLSFVFVLLISHLSSSLLSSSKEFLPNLASLSQSVDAMCAWLMACSLPSLHRYHAVP